jgi:hypothetical protein
MRRPVRKEEGDEDIANELIKPSTARRTTRVKGSKGLKVRKVGDVC